MNTINIPNALAALADLRFTADVDDWGDSAVAWTKDGHRGVAVGQGVTLLHPEGHALQKWDDLDAAISDLSRGLLDMVISTRLPADIIGRGELGQEIGLGKATPEQLIAWADAVTDETGWVHSSELDIDEDVYEGAVYIG